MTMCVCVCHAQGCGARIHVRNDRATAAVVGGDEAGRTQLGLVAS